MEKIYGKDLASLQGKTTRTGFKAVSHIVPIPEEIIENHQNVTLYVDVMYVNKLTFLTTISENICYCTVNYVKTQKKETLYDAIDHVFCQYSMAGFHISHMKVDPEFYPLLELLADELNCCIDECPAQAHVPQAK